MKCHHVTMPRGLADPGHRGRGSPGFGGMAGPRVPESPGTCSTGGSETRSDALPDARSLSAPEVHPKGVTSGYPGHDDAPVCHILGMFRERAGAVPLEEPAPVKV
jgi:hypothetical protein